MTNSNWFALKLLIIHAAIHSAQINVKKNIAKVKTGQALLKIAPSHPLIIEPRSGIAWENNSYNDLNK